MLLPPREVEVHFAYFHILFPWQYEIHLIARCSDFFEEGINKWYYRSRTKLFIFHGWWTKTNLLFNNITFVKYNPLNYIDSTDRIVLLAYTLTK